MRTSNPAFNKGVLNAIQRDIGLSSDTMTAKGTGIKTAIALALLVVAAGFTWQMIQNGQNPQPLMLGGLIVGLVLGLGTAFKPDWAQYTTPFYAVAEGLFLGGLSAIIESRFPQANMTFQAVCLTFGTMFTMLVGYQSGWIKMTDKFRAGIMAATGGVALLYLVSLGMRMFTGSGMGFIHSASLFGIGFSVFVVILAALNLVLDFDMIDRMVESGAPKKYEWYGAFALVMTLVWLYIEIIRLLTKLQSRD
jgi:uncharacterized YccA/Bax inhibitor family protein